MRDYLLRKCLIPLCLLLSACETATVSEPQQIAPPDPTGILVWHAPGSLTADMPQQAGAVGFIRDGDLIPLLDTPAARQVKACGDEATSPDGALFAFYVGGSSGQLYLMRDRAQPVVIGSAGLLSCLGGGTLRYAPDSQRLAYLDYGSTPTTGEYITGTLRVIDTSAPGEVYRHENIAAFDLSSDGAVFLRFFTNSRGQVDEAVLGWWDTSAEREVAILRPDRDCRYTSASLRLVTADNALLVLGQRCPGQGTAWQLYQAGLDDGRVALVDSGPQPGAFAAYTRTNMLLVSPDGRAAYFTIPDGVVAHTAGLMRADLETRATSVIAERQLIMPTLTRSANANTFPRLSPDSRWLAAVVTTPNDDNSLTVLDLNNPQTAYRYSTERRGDAITGLAFSPDSSRLYFTAGRVAGGRDTETALFVLDLTSGQTTRLRRGAYVPGLVLSPDAGAVGALEYTRLENPNQPPYQSLVSLAAADGESSLIYAGATLVDGRVTGQRFAYPLSWRP
jgi:hypothetical protein